MGTRRQAGIVDLPKRQRDSYLAAGLWETQTIPQQFRASARRWAGRTAVRTADEAWTYAELDRRSDSVAVGLLEAGFAPGDPVIVQLTNSAAVVSAWYGMLKAGLIPVCTLPIHRRHEIEEIAGQTGAVGHLVQAELPSFDLFAFAEEMQRLVPTMTKIISVGAPRGSGGLRVEDLQRTELTPSRVSVLDRIAEAALSDDVAVFQLSGGTTAVPKVIPRCHAEYWYNAVATSSWWGHDADSVLAFALPLVHNAGVANALHAAAAVGAELLLATPAAAVTVPLMAEHHATFLLSPPGLMHEYLAHPQFAAAFAAVEHCVLTAAPVPRTLFDDLQSRGVRVQQAFGMSEGLFMFTPPDAPAELRARTVGVPISDQDEVGVLVPDSNDPVAPGEIGELCVKGPYTIAGYLNAPERNATAFTADGFYRTGDLVRKQVIDGVAGFSIEGRAKDLISRGGEKVNAEEVERLLARSELVTEAALVAMPDDRLGERACAYIVPADPERPPDLASLCAFLEQAGLSKFKWPERVELVEALPRTPIGKVRKADLREDIQRKVAFGGPPSLQLPPTPPSPQETP